MKILSIDTSSEACSASLNLDGELITKFEIAPQKHSSLILTMCDDLLAQCDIKLNQLDAVAFGQGPGSFTGLRIAAGVTQGIAFGADLPVISVSTLAALAQQIKTHTNDTKIIAAIDARMQEVYWCIYSVDENGLVIPEMNEEISSPDNVTFENKGIKSDSVFGIGTGLFEFSDELKSKPFAPLVSNIFDNRLTSAEEIGVLAANKLRNGEVLSAGQAIPVYLRNDVAKKSSKQK